MSTGTHLNMVRWGAARRRMVGVDHGSREKNDFYETPPHAVHDLLRFEDFDGPIWEPACGCGAISEALIASGHQVISSDLVDRGYGDSGVDFLMEHRAWAPNVITNPPFKLGLEFVLHAIALCPGKVAMLHKIAFLEGQERRRLFDQHPPIRVWIFSTRVACVRGGGAKGDKIGGGMMAFGWFVWERGFQGRPELGWLP